MRTLMLFLILFASFPARPSPDLNSPSGFHEWFETLDDENGKPCCSESDCRFVDAVFNQRTNHYEAHVLRRAFRGAVAKGFSEKSAESWDNYWVQIFGDAEDAWIEVPNEKIVTNVRNPTGHSVLCWSPYVPDEGSYADTHGVYCFIPMISS